MKMRGKNVFTIVAPQKSANCEREFGDPIHSPERWMPNSLSYQGVKVTRLKTSKFFANNSCFGL